MAKIRYFYMFVLLFRASLILKINILVNHTYFFYEGVKPEGIKSFFLNEFVLSKLKETSIIKSFVRR